MPCCFVSMTSFSASLPPWSNCRVRLLGLLLALLGCLPLAAQNEPEAPANDVNNPAQMATSQLEQRANANLSQGNLREARPFLLELVRRFEPEGEGQPEIDLSDAFFFLGASYVQEYSAANQQSSLVEALRWFNRLQDTYPESSRIREDSG